VSRKLDLVALESMVDATSLEDVLSGLAEICWGKAEHVMASYQDGELSRAWNRAGRRLNKLAEGVGV
jgi:hypothetical protein